MLTDRAITCKVLSFPKHDITSKTATIDWLPPESTVNIVGEKLIDGFTAEYPGGDTGPFFLRFTFNPYTRAKPLAPGPAGNLMFWGEILVNGIEQQKIGIMLPVSVFRDEKTLKRKEITFTSDSLSFPDWKTATEPTIIQEVIPGNLVKITDEKLVEGFKAEYPADGTESFTIKIRYNLSIRRTPPPPHPAG